MHIIYHNKGLELAFYTASALKEGTQHIQVDSLHT